MSVGGTDGLLLPGQLGTQRQAQAQFKNLVAHASLAVMAPMLAKEWERAYAHSLKQLRDKGKPFTEDDVLKGININVGAISRLATNATVFHLASHGIVEMGPPADAKKEG